MFVGKFYGVNNINAKNFKMEFLVYFASYFSFKDTSHTSAYLMRTNLIRNTNIIIWIILEANNGLDVKLEKKLEFSN